MRNDQPQALPHVAIHHSAFAPAQKEQAHEIHRRLVEARLQQVDKTLRLKPFSVEEAVYELIMRAQINRTGHVFCLELKHRLHCRVELCIALNIQIKVTRLDAE